MSPFAYNFSNLSFRKIKQAKDTGMSYNGILFKRPRDKRFNTD